MITSNEENGEETPQFTAQRADEIFAFTFKDSLEPIVIIEHKKGSVQMVHCNNAFSRITGYDPEELIGMDFVDLFNTKKETHNTDQWHILLEKAQTLELEV